MPANDNKQQVAGIFINISLRQLLELVRHPLGVA